MSETLSQWQREVQPLGGQWSFRALGAGVDLADHASVRHPSASIIKVPILVTVLDAVRVGRLSLSDRVRVDRVEGVAGAGALQHLDLAAVTVHQALSLMITVSDNVATNALIKHLGLEEFRLAWNTPLFEGFALNRLMMHAPRDPNHDNFASAEAAVRLLLHLDSRASEGDETARLGLDLLGQQQIRDRIPSFLPAGVSCLNKTGELAGTRHDVALLRCDGRTVAVAMLSSGVPGVGSGTGGGVPAQIMGRTAAALVRELAR